MTREIVALIMATCLGAPAAYAVDQATLDRLSGYAKEACLLGTQFDFGANVNGNVTFSDPTKPGAEGKASVNVRNSKGAAAIFEEKLRAVADQQTRDCMKPYIDQIFKAVLSVNAPARAAPTRTHR
jgi:hypothetical protein